MTSNYPTIDDECLAKAVEGDRDAIARLIVFYAPQLNARINNRLRFNSFVEFSVEDVLQEVFTDVLNGIESFDIDGPPLIVWLNKVADNRLASMMRFCKQKKRGGEFTRIDTPAAECSDSVRMIVDAIAAEGNASPSELMQRQELVGAVREMIAELPSGEREAIREYHLEDNSLNTTAENLHKSPDATRGLVYRAKQRMRKAMEDTSRWLRMRD